MQPDPDSIDLSSLDPRTDRARWDARVSSVATRGLALRRLRRAVVRRGLAAVVLATAACIALWLTMPRNEPRSQRPSSPVVLDWALREVGLAEVLATGAFDAQ
jgi:hypothetical protein